MEMVDIVKIAEEKRKRRMLSTALVVIVAILLFLFALAAFQETTGNFTVNLNYADRNAGMSLFDNKEMKNPQSKLYADKINKLDNTTFSDIDKPFADVMLFDPNPKVREKSTDPAKIAAYEEDRYRQAEVDMIDGSHNFPMVEHADNHTYMAYTFYIYNLRNVVQHYDMKMPLLKAIKGADHAMRVVLYEDTLSYSVDGKLTEGNRRYRTIYAKGRVAGDPAYSTDLDGLVATDELELCNADENFESDTVVFTRKVDNVQPKEMRKYTVVVYLEGEDPQCVDNIKGGSISLQVDFMVFNERDDNQKN